MRGFFGLLGALLLLPSAVHAYEPNLGVAARVSTLGLSLEMTTAVTEKFNLRAGVNQFDYDYDPEPEEDGSGNELTYNGTLDLSSLGTYADWHPWGGAFRLSAGAIFKGNEITGSARCEQANCEVGDETFDSDDIGTLSALIDFDSVAPYVGLGWGNAVAADTGFGFQFDLGVMFQGTPQVSLTSNNSCQGARGTALGTAACQAELDAELTEEEQELQEEAEDFELYPVISLGVRYKFF